MWDDDPQINGDDFMDNFTIANLSSLFDFSQSNSLNVDGMEGIGNIRLAFYNLTTNPTTCNTGDNGTFSTGWLVPGGKFMARYCQERLTAPINWRVRICIGC